MHNYKVAPESAIRTVTEECNYDLCGSVTLRFCNAC